MKKAYNPGEKHRQQAPRQQEAQGYPHLCSVGLHGSNKLLHSLLDFPKSHLTYETGPCCLSNSSSFFPNQPQGCEITTSSLWGLSFCLCLGSQPLGPQGSMGLVPLLEESGCTVNSAICLCTAADWSPSSGIQCSRQESHHELLKVVSVQAVQMKGPFWVPSHVVPLTHLFFFGGGALRQGFSA